MKQVYRILILGIALMLAENSFSQQIPSLTQYVFNEYLYNPAVSGIYDYYQVKTNFRQQWVKTNNGTNNFSVSAFGPHKTLPMGYGGYFVSDNVGDYKKIGAYGSYAYNIRITNDIRLSAGVFLGVLNYSIDYSNLPNDDPAKIESPGGYHKIMPDGSFGVYMYSSQYYGGISVQQLFANKVETINSDSVDYTNIMSRLNSHYLVMGGYKYNINRDFDLEAGALLKFVRGSSPQVDMNIRTTFQKMVWFGLNYRSQDAICLLAGYNYQDMVYVGMSYDILTSPVRSSFGGNVEVLLGVKFSKIKQSGRRRKIR